MSVSSSPRGEQPGRPGAGWESWVEWQAEQYEPPHRPAGWESETTDPDANQPQPPPIPNRATRRAIARAARRKR